MTGGRADVAGLIGAVILTGLAGAFDFRPAQAQGVNLFGMPGLIDMPTARTFPDAQLTTTVGGFAGTLRNTVSFQLSPRLTASFRYTRLKNWNSGGFLTYYDRSFDLHYQLLTEGRFRPAVAIGLRDFVGTGLYSGEYLVASKRIGTRLDLTGGIGWGRLGSNNGFRNPLSRIFGSSFDKRASTVGLGGVPGFRNWFRGRAAFFAGLEWQTPDPRLSIKVEYSSDAYRPETVKRSIFTRNGSLNLAFDYRVSQTLSLSGYYMYGSRFGLRASIALNPRRAFYAGTIEGAPVPVFRRPDDGMPGAALRNDVSWVKQPGVGKILLNNLQTVLGDEGYDIIALSVSGHQAKVWFSNSRYDNASQALGRLARMMTRIMPLSVDNFVLTAVEKGLPVVSVALQRDDLARFENDPDGVEASLAAARITAPLPIDRRAQRQAALYPKTEWRIAPYIRYSLFDPANPFRYDVGLRAQAEVDLGRGLSVSGSVIKKAFGNLNTVTRLSNSVLPHVRSDFGLYDKQGDPAIEYLFGQYLFRPGRNLYGRVSLGYLEYMYGGVSAEVLWKPVDSRLALGAEVNLVRQRDFNLLFGFRNYQVATGHVSAYWAMRNGYAVQVDAGRYLAGDWGATFSVDRTFSNGWKVGAFVTFTNVPFKRFGEGSFDKGIRFTVPLSWALGQPSKRVSDLVIRPVTRDGGARLFVQNRLYPLVSQYHEGRLAPTWARFWR